MASSAPRTTIPCRSCGTPISGNALICYKCGTATTAARIPAPAAPRPVWRRTVVRALLLAALAAAIVRVVACGSLL